MVIKWPEAVLIQILTLARDFVPALLFDPLSPCSLARFRDDVAALGNFANRNSSAR
jgi:hypothetical protein